MPKKDKRDEYRDALEDLARLQHPSDKSDKSTRQKELEGKAAKLGIEIQGEESKAAPRQRN